MFKIIYEKYFENLISRILSIRFTDVVNTSSAKLCHRFASICKDIRNYIFGYLIPLMIINLRYVFVLLFLLLGISGLIGVFHYPKLQVPTTQKVTFFLKDNPMEIYELFASNYDLEKDFEAFYQVRKFFYEFNRLIIFDF